MKIDFHIHSLLYDHDCVIIPDFGGFVADRKGAQVNAAKNILYPPSRRIAFNAALKNNDGLLAHHIAQEKQIAYAAACDEIKNYTGELFDSLNAGQRFMVEKVGAFYFDAEKNIQFAPDLSQNYLYESYGLSMVHATVKQADETVLTFQTNESDSAERKSGKVRWMKLVPAAAVFALILMSPKIIPRVNTEFSSLLPVTEQKAEPVVVKPAAENNIAPEINTEVPAAVTEEPAVETENNFPAKETPVAVTSPASKNNFYIIAGCFRIEENAVKLEAELKSKGFDAFIIGKNAAGLTMVSAASFSNSEEAKNNLSAFQNEIIEGAWVYKGKF